MKMEEADEVEVMDVDIEEEDENLSFEEMGLDPRLIRTLAKKNITKPTPVQLKAIPLILEGKDVVARAKTGSGKTFAYLLPLLQKLFSCSNASMTGPSAFVLVPTRELCQQVHMEISSLLEHCKGSWKVVQLASSMSHSDLRSAMVGSPDIIVATPACIATCITKKILQVSSLQESLSTLVLDEADLLLSYGYEDDLRSLVPYIPRRCQCLLMSATTSADVEKIKKLVLHSPVVLTLTEVEGNMDNGVVPKSVQQFWISCEARDKLLHVLALLRLELVQKKVLIFVNSIDAGFRLKLFLEQFGIRSAVLNAELPQNSRLHLLEEFNSGLFDYLIATDDSKPAKLEKEHVEEVQRSSKKTKKRQKKTVDSEFGVIRGIDFKNVYTVINFDMPLSTSGYIHRIGRTGRAYSTGTSVSLVSPEEESIFREIKVALSGSEENTESEKFISPFPLLTKNAVESLRYRAQDIAKSVTKVAVREARASDLRNEILNSERLKTHFEDNPKDLELLKHDKVLSKKQPSSHLRAVPDYLVDPTTEAASRAVKLARVVMGEQSKPRNRGWLKKKSGRSADPLKTFSVGSKKGSWKGSSKKRKGNGSDRERPKKKDKSSK